MDLKIDYGQTRNTGGNVQNQAGQFKALLNQIQSLNDNLKQFWKGADAESYTRKIDEQAQIMNKLQSSIQEIGEYLVKVGNAYEQAMNDNKLS